MHSATDSGEGSSKKAVIAISIVGLIGIITLALAAAAFVSVNKRFNELNDKFAVFENGPWKVIIAAFSTTAPVVNTTTTTVTSTVTSTTTSSTAASTPAPS